MILGLFTFAAAVVSVTIHVWLRRGVLVPITGPGVEYLFVSATRRSALAIAVWTAALLLAAHALLRWRAGRRVVQPPLFSWSDTAYLAPLCWFAVTALALLILIPPVSRSLAVVSYAIVDMRWWWIALVIAWTARRADARLHGLLRDAVASRLDRWTRSRWVGEISIA